MKHFGIILTAFFAVPLLAFRTSTPANCGAPNNFHEVIGNSFQIRWVKVLQFSDISYNRAHSSQAKATVVECDWSDCLSCTHMGKVIDIYPDRSSCQRMEIGKTYLVGTSSTDDLAAKVILEPNQWARVRNLCYFKNQTQRTLLTSPSLSRQRCPSLEIADLGDSNCLPDNSSINSLLKTSISLEAAANFSHDSCIQTSPSFAERLAFAGSASIVRFTGMWAYGYQQISAQPCNEVRCTDLLSWNQEATANGQCKVRFGNASEITGISMYFRYPLDSECYNFDWKGPITDGHVYLIFHEPITDPWMPFVWVRADPVLLTVDLWKDVAQTCYFTRNLSSPLCSNGAKGCLDDVILSDHGQLPPIF